MNHFLGLPREIRDIILEQYIAICGKNYPMLTLACPHEQSIIKTHLSSIFLRDHVDDSISFATNFASCK